MINICNPFFGRTVARSTSGTDQKTASNHLFQRLSLVLQKERKCCLAIELDPLRSTPAADLHPLPAVAGW